MKNNNKGITLIALVITIIVLLILAGVSIAMLTGDNGILSNATKSVAETNIAEDREAATLDLSAAYSDYMEEKYVNNATYTDFIAFLKADPDGEGLITNNAQVYLNDSEHYTVVTNGGTGTDIVITTKSVNNNNKTEYATVDGNGGFVTGAEGVIWNETAASE